MCEWMIWCKVNSKWQILYGIKSWDFNLLGNNSYYCYRWIWYMRIVVCWVKFVGVGQHLPYNIWRWEQNDVSHMN